MANLSAYFDVIYEIKGNGEDITRISIQIQWEQARAIKMDSDLIVRVNFKLKEEPILISQKIAATQIVYEGGVYKIALDGEYVAIGSFAEEDITEAVADIYYIQEE